jgi:hypothetical protein
VTPALLAAFFGWIALPISILRYQARTATGILLFSALASFLFAASYAFTGALAGAALTAAGGATSLAQAAVGRRLSVLSRMLIATPSIGLALWSSSTDPLAGLALLAFAASRLAETCGSETRMRQTMLLAAILWLTYAAMAASLPVVLAEAIGLVSASIGLWRFRRTAKPVVL